MYIYVLCENSQRTNAANGTSSVCMCVCVCVCVCGRVCVAWACVCKDTVGGCVAGNNASV